MRDPLAAEGSKTFRRQAFSGMAITLKRCIPKLECTIQHQTRQIGAH